MKVLMAGAGRTVRGGVSSVVNGYYEAGLDSLVDLTYLPTMEDGTKLKKLLVAAMARLRFESLIRDADIFHVHMSSDASFHRKAIFIKRAHALGKKIIIHMHGSTFDLFYLERCSEAGRRKVREIFGLADAVIALSDYWQGFLGQHICSPEKIHLIYNSVIVPAADIAYSASAESAPASHPGGAGGAAAKEEPSRPKAHSQDILFLGLIGPRKGTYDLIRAFAVISDAFPNACLHICGDGEREKARALAIELGLNDGGNVIFHGWVRDAEKEALLSGCSIYCLPSYHEGMPMSVLEAMARGLATISTTVGGIPHIIEDGRNGLLTDPGDIEGLSKALSSLLESQQLRETLGRAGRNTIENRFNLKKTIVILKDLYEEILP